MSDDAKPTMHYDESRIPHAPYYPTLMGQPAIVTGANSGIGEAVAIGLARAGADVAINYVTHPETADEVAHKIEALGRKAITIQADVSKEDEVDGNVRQGHRGIRHAAHLGQQRGPAAGFVARRHDAAAVEHGDRHQPDRPVSSASGRRRESS